MTADGMTDREWADSLTADDCERIIASAMDAKDFKAVLAALDILRRKDARRAADVLAVIEAGLIVAKRRNGAA